MAVLHPESPYIFPSEKTGARLTESALRHLIQKHMKEARLEGLSSHDLRHRNTTNSSNGAAVLVSPGTSAYKIDNDKVSDYPVWLVGVSGLDIAPHNGFSSNG